MTVELWADVARMVEEVRAMRGDSADEVVNKTLRVWFGLMTLCSCDPQADALMEQLLSHAAALAASGLRQDGVDAGD